MTDEGDNRPQTIHIRTTHAVCARFAHSAGRQGQDQGPHFAGLIELLARCQASPLKGIQRILADLGLEEKKL